MSAALTARQRARRELTAEILAAARAQLAERGAAALSVREVARATGLVSSAVYRYFATRDALLTALIVEAYDGVADAVERAAAPGGGRTPRERFTDAAGALRAWARDHRHEWALLHGSPVPGYAGDARTTAAATRTPAALLSLLPPGAPVPGRAPGAALAGQAAAVAAALAPQLSPAQVARGARAWTALLGLVSSELFGQLTGAFEPADALVEDAVAALADDLGL